EMRLLQQFFFAVAEQPAQRRIGAQESAAYGKQRDADRRILVKPLKSGTVGDRRICFFAFVLRHDLPPAEIMTYRAAKAGRPGKERAPRAQRIVSPPACAGRPGCRTCRRRFAATPRPSRRGCAGSPPAPRRAAGSPPVPEDCPCRSFARPPTGAWVAAPPPCQGRSPRR